MDPRTRAADPAHIAWLRRAGAHRRRHSKRTLLDHLVGTRDLLAAWGACDAVCDAGLFHSVYGTSALREALLPPARREVVRGLIGAEAERRVWLFHALDRPAFRALIAAGLPAALPLRGQPAPEALAQGELEDLANLLAANALEQRALRSREDLRRTLALLPLRPLLLPPAVQALEQLLARGPART